MLASGLKNIKVTDLELNIKEKIYAIDAFKLIEENYKDVELFFIMGADNFINIMKWRNGEELIKKYKYIVLDRDDINLQEYIDSKKIRNSVTVIKNQDYNTCSSSEFRRSFKEEKRYNKEIIPDAVIDYIIENNLF